MITLKYGASAVTSCKFWHWYSVRFFNKKYNMRILNVAEKNDAAKNIANFLSRGTSRRREGLSRYNKIYEFDYIYNGQKSIMVMTSVSGHLLTYAFVGQYRKWNSCSPEDLFDAPVIKECPEDYQQIQSTIKREVRLSNILIIWTDCDREGENIGFEIIDVCRQVKPNIQVYRAKFSEITMQSVQNSMSRLGQANKLVSDAVDVRSELDLRIGASFTRFQTLRLKRVFPDVLGDSLISYGSCQFPTMGFVVQRYKEVQDFIPEAFWKLKVTHTLNKLTVEFVWKRLRLFDEGCCRILHERCLDNPVAKVENVVTKAKSKWRPVPLDTIELEKAANRYLKLSAKETMKIAEQLYSRGLVSYPRTETNIFPKNMDLAALVQEHTSDGRWGQFANKILQDGVNPRQGKKSDQAHPPIHPTKYTDGLNGNDRKVYEYIVRRFLACLSKDAEGFETVVQVDVHDEKFVANGLQIVALNYLEVYPYEKWTTKEIHMYRQGQTFTPSSVDMVEGQTSAPKLLTEAELIALMDKHGIGTDATHADHIDKIQKRMYVGLIEGQYFTPGELGIGLVDGYDSMGFEMSKPYLRAELERDLKKICEGVKNPKMVLREQINKYREVFRKTVEHANKLDIALSKYLRSQPRAIENSTHAVVPHLQESALKCSSCGAGMALRHRKSNTSFISCTRFPTCRNAIWLTNKVLEVQLTPDTCPQCGPDVRILQFKFRSGSMAPYYEDTCTGCVGGCDEQFLQMLEVKRCTRRDGIDAMSSSRAQNSGGTLPINSTFESRFQSGQNLGAQLHTSFNTQRGSRQQDLRNDFRTGYNESHFGNSSTASSRHQMGNYFGNSSAPSDNQWRNNFGRFNATGTNQLGNNMWNSQRASNANTGQGENEDVQCNCGIPAKRLTVLKDTVNKGRQFYSCSKSMGDPGKCQFFCWADIGSPTDTNIHPYENNDSGGNSTYNNQSTARNNNQSTSNTIRAKTKFSNNRTSTTGSMRKCGNCREIGHTKNNCPLKEEIE